MSDTTFTQAAVNAWRRCRQQVIDQQTRIYKLENELRLSQELVQRYSHVDVSKSITNPGDLVCAS